MPTWSRDRSVRTPSARKEIEKIVLEGAVGSLLAHARDESKRSLSTVGTVAGVELMSKSVAIDGRR